MTTNTTAGLEPQYVERFRQAFAANGGRLERLIYARPLAQGDVRAYLALPAQPQALVVVAHGTGNDCLYPQMSIIKSLVSAGVAVFTFDVDGHGVGSTTLLSPQSLADAAVAAYDAAVAHVPSVPVYVMGISLGGLLALKAAASRRVAGLIVLVSPILTGRSLSALAIEGAGLARPTILRQIPTYGALRFLPAIGSFRRDEFPVRLGAGLGKGPLEYLTVVGKFINRLGALDIAKSVACKSLLVYGGHDLIAPVKQGRELASALKASRFAEMPLGTHLSTPLLPATERLILEFIKTE